MAKADIQLICLVTALKVLGPGESPLTVGTYYVLVTKHF